MEIWGIIISCVAIVLSILMWLFKPDLIKEVFQSQKVTGYIKKQNLDDNFTIAIVDDEIDSYPINYIRNLGYKVVEFESISFSQAEQLSKYNLVLLDVKGVVKEDKEEGGAKLIKIVKDIRPLLPIIAVSSGYFHTELNDYFRTCDDNIRKPIDEYKIREMIIELKSSFYDANEIARSLDNEIDLLPVSKHKKKSLSLKVIKYLKDEMDSNTLKVVLHKLATTKTEDVLGKIEKLKDRLSHA